MIACDSHMHYYYNQMKLKIILIDYTLHNNSEIKIEKALCEVEYLKNGVCSYIDYILLQDYTFNQNAQSHLSSAFL